jgi:predicted metal-dependent HD superfamily phosphohydrolase
MSHTHSPFQDAFLVTLGAFSVSAAEQSQLWQDIAQHYSEPHRHYHNLQHLDALIGELQAVSSNIEAWNTVVLAVAYHDVIYNARYSDNEERSAAHALQQLQRFLDAAQLQSCQEMILATKGHQCSANTDTNYFTDADLSILGAAKERYQQYRLAIRKEYSIYPDAMYAAGRQSVLRHFLEMPRIYNTPQLAERYEAAARANLEEELRFLQGL